MKATLALILLLATAIIVAAQTNPTEFRPYIFEPYSAGYKYRGNILGYEFRLFDFGTRVFEHPDHWEEAQTWRFKLPDEPEMTISATSTVDLATGLLRKMSVNDGGKMSAEMTFRDGAIDIAATDGKKTKQMTVVNPDKIYPCYYSSVFYSYLPLKENYEGSFTCLAENSDSDSREPEFLIQRLTLKVVGRERISTKAGTFDCFKLTSDVVDLRRIRNGKVTELSGKKTPQKDPEKFWKNVYSYTWVDTRTRKIVLGEFNFKGLGGITAELEKSAASTL